MLGDSSRVYSRMIHSARQQHFNPYQSMTGTSNSSRSSPYNSHRAYKPVLQQNIPPQLYHKLPLNLNIPGVQNHWNSQLSSARGGAPKSVNSVGGGSTARMPMLSGRELAQIPERAEPELQVSSADDEINPNNRTSFSTTEKKSTHQPPAPH